MKYPFYKHQDIKVLYWTIGIFGFFFLSAWCFEWSLLELVFLGIVLICLTIALIGHEIMIILFEKFKLKGYRL